MTDSRRIAGLLGPTLVALAVSEAMNLRIMAENPASVGLVYLNGTLLFVAGVAIIQVHNRWTRHWPVLVTVMGWFAILAGLVNQANPWRCAKKTRGFIQAGYVDPENLLFVRERIRDVREVAPKVYETINTLDGKCAEILRGHPFYEAPDIEQVLRRLVDSPDLKLTS